MKRNFFAFALMLALCFAAPAAWAGVNTIDMSESSPTQSGTGWTYADNVYTVNGDVTITGDNTGSQRRIKAASGASVTITLNNVSIDVSTQANACALDLSVAGECTVILADGSVNTLKSGEERPGIYVPENKKLTLDGTGRLDVYGGQYWPGIGRSEGAGVIEIQGGTVKATGGQYAAGIGGSSGSPGGTIMIDGGTVSAQGGEYGAGIGGGGASGSGGTTTITGGTVSVTGGYSAAGIGGGHGGSGGTTTITGGTVSAQGGDGGAGIGGGYLGDGATTTITGGTVSAMGSAGGYAGAGIGGGYNYKGSAGTTTVTGGSVKVSSVSSQPTNGSGTNIYLNTLTVGSPARCPR